MYRCWPASERTPGRTALTVMLLAACAPLPAQQSADDGKRLFEAYCAACHSLELPMSQQLDRDTWSWVLDDMTGKFGCAMGEADRKLILDFLVETYGPDSD